MTCSLRLVLCKYKMHRIRFVSVCNALKHARLFGGILCFDKSFHDPVSHLSCEKRSCSLMQCLLCLEPPGQVQVASACLCDSLSPSSNLHKNALMWCWGCTHCDVGPDCVFMHVPVCVTHPSCDSCALFNSTLKNQASLSTNCLSQISPAQSALNTVPLFLITLALLSSHLMELRNTVAEITYPLFSTTCTTPLW